VPGAGAHQPPEIIEISKLEMHGVMAALGQADRVRAAGIAGPGVQRIIASFAVRPADRMNGGEIQDVEAERGDVGQPSDAILECAMGPGEARRPRGIISYQALARAMGRSTTSGQFRLRVRSD
jgi:hypothetical protein